MNVLTILCAGGWMPDNLSEGWRRLGCQVHEFFYGTHMGRDWTARGRQDNAIINSNLLACATQLKKDGMLDLIFAVIYDDVLSEETARALRALGVPMINYHVDLVGQWYRILKTGKYFDRVACAQEIHWNALRRAGIRPCLMPMAANPPQPAITTENTFDFDGLLYLGSPWVYRMQILARLIQHDLPVRIYGHNWHNKSQTQTKLFSGMSDVMPRHIKYLHDVKNYLLPRVREEGLYGLMQLVASRYFSERMTSQERTVFNNKIVIGSYRAEDFARLVSGASINLGFTHFSGRPGSGNEYRQVRLREFEIPMAGGFSLTQRCPELSSLFKENVHVACWDGFDDLLEKSIYFLENPGERVRIANAGREHALRFHTWRNRFSGLLAELGITSPEIQSAVTNY